jgi:hypothetical protein
LKSSLVNVIQFVWLVVLGGSVFWVGDSDVLVVEGTGDGLLELLVDGGWVLELVVDGEGLLELLVDGGWVLELLVKKLFVEKVGLWVKPQIASVHELKLVEEAVVVGEELLEMVALAVAEGTELLPKSVGSVIITGNCEIQFKTELMITGSFHHVLAEQASPVAVVVTLPVDEQAEVVVQTEEHELKVVIEPLTVDAHATVQKEIADAEHELDELEELDVSVEVAESVPDGESVGFPVAVAVTDAVTS